jgi:hypothetical protein
MNEVDNSAWAVMLILILIILLPVGWVVVVATPEPYHEIRGEPLREALENSGITVTSAVDSTLPLPGVTGGKIYTISDENGKLVTIQTQSFDSAGSRDAAIKLHHAQSVGKGKPIEEMVVVGNHLIFVRPGTGGTIKKILPELQKIKAR